MAIEFFAQHPGGHVVLSAIEPFKFPGGEWHLRLPAEPETPAYARVNGCTADDLVLLGLWADSAHQAGHRAIAHIPYLPAARADRGTPFGAKVYANMINAAGLDEVVVFDPHSPVAPSLVQNVRIVYSAEVLAEVLREAGEADSYRAVLAPDKGAVERASKAADALGLPLFTATKTRDFDTGKLTSFEVPQLPRSGRVLVVDDICDGGGTFRGLATAAGIGRDRLALWVSHGIFSGAAGELTGHFAQIFTTDSHPGARRADVGAHVTELAPYLESERN